MATPVPAIECIMDIIKLVAIIQQFFSHKWWHCWRVIERNAGTWGCNIHLKKKKKKKLSATLISTTYVEYTQYVTLIGELLGISSEYYK